MDTISLGVRRKALPLARSHALAFLRLWRERARSRRQLRLLLTDPRVLADLGLTRDQAGVESIKPFWR
jgi:uncharacterized protein YjiS (DUF1127 family)